MTHVKTRSSRSPLESSSERLVFWIVLKLLVDSNIVDIQVFVKQKCQKCLWFQLLHSEDLMLYVILIFVLTGFGQNVQFKDARLNFWHFFSEEKRNKSNRDELIMIITISCSPMSVFPHSLFPKNITFLDPSAVISFILLSLFSFLESYLNELFSTENMLKYSYRTGRFDPLIPFWLKEKKLLWLNYW